MSEKKCWFALLIGNQNYTEQNLLLTPLADVALMKKSLLHLGFEETNITVIEDARLDGMRKTLETFAGQLVDNTVGFFYFSGHAIQYEDCNYLLPIDFDFDDVKDVNSAALSVKCILKWIEHTYSKFSIIVLDACRNNPFGNKEVNKKGLINMPIIGIGNLVIAYSTQAGEIASDGLKGAKNSPYTTVLAEKILTPNEPITTVLTRVRKSVQKITGEKQLPEYNASTGVSFRFFVKELIELYSKSFDCEDHKPYYVQFVYDEDLPFAFIGYTDTKARTCYISIWKIEKKKLSYHIMDYFKDQGEQRSPIASCSEGFLATTVKQGYVQLCLYAFQDSSGKFRAKKTYGKYSEQLVSIAHSAESKKRLVLSACQSDGSLKLWDIDSAELLLDKEHPYVLSVALSPDGSKALSGGMDGTIRLWDIPSGKMHCLLENDSNQIHVVAFSPTGNLAVSGSRDGTINIWDIVDNNEVIISELEDDKKTDVSAIAISPDDRFILSGYGDGTLIMWDILTKKAVLYEKHAKIVDSVAFSKDGKLVLSASSEGREVKLWKVKD